jgi:predicted alpha/beta superfamily hydrolase
MEWAMRETRIIHNFLLCLLITISINSPLSSQSHLKIDVPNVFFADTELRTLKSDYVNQSFSIEVYLPPSYSDSLKSFPVVYLLDSDISFGLAKNTIDWLLLGREIPELILVGISYREGFDNWWTKRSRDYTPSKDETEIWGDWPLAGGADDFIKFLKNELIPFIDSNYRTVENERTIAGISFGGLFASYVLFKEPILFSKYLMSGPALIWNNKYIFDLESDYFGKHKKLQVTMFTSVGGLDDSTNIIQPWKDFNEILKNRNYNGFKFKQEIFSNETHFSVWPSSFTRGIKFLFTDNK